MQFGGHAYSCSACAFMLSCSASCSFPKIQFWEGDIFLLRFVYKMGDFGFEMSTIEKYGIDHFGTFRIQFWEGVISLLKFIILQNQ